MNREAREVLGNVQNKCNGCQACASVCPLLLELGGLTLPEVAEQAFQAYEKLTAARQKLAAAGN